MYKFVLFCNCRWFKWKDIKKEMIILTIEWMQIPKREKKMLNMIERF